MALSIVQYVSKYTEFLNKLLGAGPDISANLDDLQLIREAVNRIAMRVSDRFGAEEPAIDFAAIRADATVQGLEQQVADKLAGSEKFGALRDRGPLTDVLQMLFTFLMQNPELLNLILSLFKKKPA